MRKRNYFNLPIEKQIKKLKIELKIHMVYWPILCLACLIAGVLFLVFDFPLQLPIGIFIFTATFGACGGVSIYAYKKKIKKLEEEQNKLTNN